MTAFPKYNGLSCLEHEADNRADYPALLAIAHTHMQCMGTIDPSFRKEVRKGGILEAAEIVATQDAP